MPANPNREFAAGGYRRFALTVTTNAAPSAIVNGISG
jgi:hypothetical protein